MIYALCVVIICFSAYVGNRLSKVYVLRDNFFSELSELLNRLKNNYNYQNLYIEEIIREYASLDIKSKKKIESLLNYFKSGDEKNITRELHFLKSQEKQQLLHFFNNLGSGNTGVEVNNVDNYLAQVSALSAEASAKRKTNEKLIYKVSIAVGVVICILIV